MMRTSRSCLTTLASTSSSSLSTHARRQATCWGTSRKGSCSKARVANESSNERSVSHGGDGVDAEPPFRPVFRNTTLLAERRRKFNEEREGMVGNARKLKVLFVEEGLGCRSVLAETVFKGFLEAEELEHLVECDVAAILPFTEAVPIEADGRAVDIAKQHGLQVSESRSMIRPFDDVNDSVNFDLVVVMDRFDHAEVLKEVAAYDNIFPGGYYGAKVRRLAGFETCTKTHCIVQRIVSDQDHDPSKFAEEEDRLDISDPLYTIGADLSHMEETEIFEGLFEEISLACEGLVHFIVQLQEVAKLKGVGLVHEVSMNLRTNDIGIGNLAKRSTKFSKQNQRSRTPERSSHSGGICYINKDGIPVSLAREPQSKSRGYWMNLENVKKELIAWAEQHNEAPGTMPIAQAIKDSGNYMIFHSIAKYHGGTGTVAKRLGWTMEKRKNKGFWLEWGNIYDALNPYLDCSRDEEGEEVCVIPTKSSLIEKGRQDIVGAIDRIGGFRLFAQQFNLKTKSRGRRALYPDLQDWDVYKEKLKLWVMTKRSEGELEGEMTKMPKMREMASGGANDLHYATKKYHGGVRRVAAKMGWQI